MRIQVIETARGSFYENDRTGMRIRRVVGFHDPTPRQGRDGDWLAYQHLDPPVVGQSLHIVWRVDATVNGPVIRMTVTSPVVSIGSEERKGVGSEPTAPPPAAQGEEAS